MSLSLRESLRRAPRGFLGMLALMVATEGYIARNDLKFSRLEAEDWKSSARVAEGQLPMGGVFFFGDSQVKFGVSPLLLESKLGQPSHCLAIQGGQAPSSYFLLKKTLASGVIPSALVVDFEPHLMMDGIDHNKRMWAELADFGELFDLAWQAGDANAFASMALARVLPSYRERFEIRDNIKAALKGETPGMASWLEMAMRNKGMNRGALAMAKEQHGVIELDRWANPTPRPWAPEKVNDHYAREFLKLAADNKIPVFCLLMPVAPGIQAKYEKNGMDQHYFAWLRTLQDRYGNLFVLDWRHSNYQDPVFNDALHLDMEGALSITSALGDYLQKAFRGEGIDRRWVAMPAFRADGVAIAVEDSNRSNLFMQSTATPPTLSVRGRESPGAPARFGRNEGRPEMADEPDALHMHWMSLDDVFAKTISYAQNFEDILLGRALPGPEGFYLDVGANHPVFHSVTKLFSGRGWRGINIEPSPVVFRLLVEDRPLDINLNVGIGSAEGTLTFYESLTYHGWSTFRPDLARHYLEQGVATAERAVPVTTLARVCEEHVDRTIDFLKIDAEGFEREVLLGADFDRWRPRVLLIENSWPEAWESLLDGIRYLPAAFDGLNRFYVREEDEALLPAFASTANVLDNFIPHEAVRLFRQLTDRVERAERDAATVHDTRSAPRRLARKVRSAIAGLARRAG